VARIGEKRGQTVVSPPGPGRLGRRSVARTASRAGRGAELHSLAPGAREGPFFRRKCRMPPASLSALPQTLLEACLRARSAPRCGPGQRRSHPALRLPGPSATAVARSLARSLPQLAPRSREGVGRASERALPVRALPLLHPLVPHGHRGPLASERSLERPVRREQGCGGLFSSRATKTRRGEREHGRLRGVYGSRACRLLTHAPLMDFHRKFLRRRLPSEAPAFFPLPVPCNVTHANSSLLLHVRVRTPEGNVLANQP